jgi:hypothetical protein
MDPNSKYPHVKRDFVLKKVDKNNGELRHTFFRPTRSARMPKTSWPMSVPQAAAPLTAPSAAAGTFLFKFGFLVFGFRYHKGIRIWIRKRWND